MPLVKRAVSPVEVSLHRLPPNIRNNELECVSNGTLTNLVRQLSSLSKHAESIFGELFHEAVKLDHKTNTLLSRVDRLAKKVTQLDSNVEEVSLQDLHLRKPFKSSSLIDQQSLSRGTLPTAMAECYAHCDSPPDLDKLNPYRDDDKLGLKFYTDPDYFFELWRQEMLKDAEVARKVRHPKPRINGEAPPTAKKKRVRQPADHRAKYFEKALRTGEIIDLPPEYQTPEFLRQQAATNPNRYVGQGHPPPGMVRPGRLEGLGPGQNGQISSGYGSGSDATDYSLPQSAAAQYSAASTAMGNNPHQHPRVSMHQAYYQQQQQQYIMEQQQMQNQSQNHRYQQEVMERVVTSQYMAAGYALNQGGPDPLGMIQKSRHVLINDTPTPGATSPTSSSEASGRLSSRPSQPPPAPPPPGVAGSPDRTNHVNGDLRNRIGRLNIGGEQGSPVRASPPRPTAQPPPAPSGAAVSGSASTSGDHLTPGRLPTPGRSSPDLPPPPPPLTPDQYAGMTTSIMSTTSVVTIEKLPSPPPASFGTPVNRGGAAPPPPPPPPPPSGYVGSTAPSSGGGKTLNGFAVKESMSTDKGAVRNDGSENATLEEKKREQAAVNEGHDVAAILKRRMEGVLGGSESSSEEEWEPDDEWE